MIHTSGTPVLLQNMYVTLADSYCMRAYYACSPWLLQESACSKMLVSINVPDFIKRPPRSVSERGHWKG